MVLEGANGHTHLSQSLLDGTISFDRPRLIVAIPIDHIGLAFTCGLNDLSHWFTATPAEPDAAASERRRQLLQTSEHEIHAGGTEDVGLKERLIEHKQRDHFIALVASRRQRRLIAQPEIPPEPYDTAHQCVPSEIGGLAVVTATS